MSTRRNQVGNGSAERTADQLAQPASRTRAVEGTGARAIRPQDDEDDLIARNSERARATPRRYEHAVAKDE